MNSNRYLLQTLHTWKKNRIILKDWNYSLAEEEHVVFVLFRKTNQFHLSYCQPVYD